MKRFFSRIASKVTPWIPPWVKEESRRLMPVVLFFFVAFSLVDLTEIFMHHSQTASYFSICTIFVASLLMGKVVLISDYLPFISLFSKKPLIYSTIWTSAVYTLCSLVVRLVDRAVPFYLDEKNFHLMWVHIGELLSKPQFWVAQMWLGVLFVVFVANHKLVVAVGTKKVRRLFFG